MAELAWRAAELAAEHGWDGAWRLLLDRALAGSAGRRSQTERERAALGRRVSAALAPEPLRALRALAVAPAARAGAADTDGSAARPAAARPSPAVMIEALRADGAGGAERLLGRGRAAEIGWNAALPLLAAAAAASGDAALARANAALVERWPAPRPYGRTRALAALLGRPRGGGAQHAQGLLHLQELWCERGGCGVCPLSSGDALAAAAAITRRPPLE